MVNTSGSHVDWGDRRPADRGGAVRSRAGGVLLVGRRRRRRQPTQPRTRRRPGRHARPELELPAGYEGYTSEVYADDAHWLCKPGIEDDVCSRDLDATAVAADGTIDVIEHETAEDPPVDCFYVYPTTSADPGPNSDFDPGEPAEIATVYNQVARLSSTCRVYAPCTASSPSRSSPEAPRRPKVDPPAVAYGDVLGAFKDYIANESDGRGFVLVGHSQGAGMLTRLIEGEIDDEPRLRDRLVAAYLLGSTVHVPE